MADLKKAAAPATSLKDLMRRGIARPVRQVELPPSGSFVAPHHRTERPEGWADTVRDHSKASRLFAAVGPGGSGKTTTMRVFGELLGQAELLDTTILAAADPGPRSLLRYFMDVDGPAGNSAAAGLEFMAHLFGGLSAASTDKMVVRGLLDCGAGNTSLGAFLATNRYAVRKLKGSGVKVIGGYFFTPRVSDLRSVLDLEAAGFTPDETLIVLNLSKADGPAAFDTLRGQAGYQALLARGAVEVFMPALPQAIALRLEDDGTAFLAAMKGGEDSDLSDAVRDWWDSYVAELGPVVARWVL